MSECKKYTVVKWKALGHRAGAVLKAGTVSRAGSKTEEDVEEYNSKEEAYKSLNDFLNGNEPE